MCVWGGCGGVGVCFPESHPLSLEVHLSLRKCNVNFIMGSSLLGDLLGYVDSASPCGACAFYFTLRNMGSSNA